MSFTNTSATLLLVDDDPQMLQLLQKVVSKSFDGIYTIESLPDPTAARQRIEAGDVDIVITDLSMPQVSGLELLRCAKARNACTQVLLLTGHASHQTLLEALETGASDYLLKPFDEKQLIKIIEEAHQRRCRWLQSLATIWQQRKQAVATSAG